jgi:ASTRA-associated protein 1
MSASGPPVPPPLQPRAILRGHAAAVHAAAFVRTGLAGASSRPSTSRRLLTGDAEGWVVAWDLTTRRPRAVWKAHEGAILGLGEWAGGSGDEGRIITYVAEFSPWLHMSVLGLSMVTNTDQLLR